MTPYGFVIGSGAAYVLPDHGWWTITYTLSPPVDEKVSGHTSVIIS